MFPSRLARFWKDQSGVIGIEAAILVLALVVVSVGFANAALTSGLIFTNTAQETASETLGRLDTLALRSSVVLIASSTGTSGVVSEIAFQVAITPGATPIDVTPGRIIIRYSDSHQSKIFDDPAGFSSTGLGGADSDMILEPNELFGITMSGLDSTGSESNKLTHTLGPGMTFTLEVIPPNGTVLLFSRRTPTFLDKNMRLD
tara:strand:+ start:347 stop:952 length:606 start_codon:yes stop_codon:yes gene_type:complete